MTTKFERLALMQRWKTVYILFAYLLSGAVAVTMMIYFSSIIGVLEGVVLAFCLGWVLTKVVDNRVKIYCPLCNSGQLVEKYGLQCQMPEYQCGICQRTYVDGSVVEK